jgi:twinkle protein
MTEESTLTHKGACEACGSSDANAYYSDGHSFCFSCQTHVAGESGSAPTPKARGAQSFVSGEVSALPARGITDETCRKWGYLKGTAYNPETKQEEPCQIANYRADDGTLIAQKIRFKGKVFTFSGDGKQAHLYGKHLWRDGGKKIVITEGEIDALTVSQLQSNKWPVVSIAKGAGGAKKAIGANLEWLLGFDEIVLMFDDDEPGRDAVAEVAPMFPVGRCKVARIDGHKDANEALVAGNGGRVIDAIWSAKEFRPDGIVDIESVVDRAAAKIVQSPHSWPWPTLNEATHGRRRAEVYGLAGGTGMGKTTVFKQVQAHIIETEKVPIAIFALEEPVHHSAKTLAGVIDGVRYHVPGIDYDEDKLRATLTAMNGRVYLYDHFGGATYETIVEKMRYMRHAFGVQDFFLDHLTALASTMGDDERKAIDRMMAELSALMLELDSTLYYISHLATPEGKSHEEGGRVLERHLRGSRAIAYWSHFIFALEGNKQEPLQPRKLRVLKDRFTGDANGLVIGLQYEKATGRMVECDVDDNAGGSHGFKQEGSGDF